MRSERVALISCPTLYKPLKNILCMNYDGMIIKPKNCFHLIKKN